MEENSQLKLSEKKTIHIVDDDSLKEQEMEPLEFFEDTIGQLKPVFEKINQLTDEIEKNSDEITIKAKNPSVIEKNQQILNELYSKGEFFLRQISTRLASYPKGIAESFRDKHIKNKALNLVKRLDANKALTKYRNLLRYPYLKDGNEKPEFKTAKEEATKSFDSIYSSSLSFLKTIEGDNWAKSNNGINAIREVHYLLKHIGRDALSLEKYDEIFNIIKIYENSSTLTKDKRDSDYFLDIISNTINNFHKDVIPNKEKMSEVCRNDPYLILNYFKKRVISFDSESQSFIEQQLDKIINESKENNYCNVTVVDYFKQSLKFNPEKYGLDPKNRSFIFENIKSSRFLRGSNYLEENFYFFKQELSSLPEDEVNNIVKSYDSYDFKKSSAQLLFSSMNLSENNFKEIFHFFEKDCSLLKEEEYSKESLLQCFKKSNSQFIPFLKYRQFNLTPEDRISIFKENIQNCSSSYTAFVFLTQIFSNFKDVFENILEDQYEEMMNQLIYRSMDGEIENLRILYTLIPGYDVPFKFKEKINNSFSKKYSARNRNDVGKIFIRNEEGKQFSKNEEWLISKEEIIPSLEIEFYSQGTPNDLRHFFFDVLEGKRKSTNMDLLIRKYAERIDEFNAEEYIDLFITNKKVPMEYSGIFLEKIQDVVVLFSQLETSVRLNQISENEYKNILIDLAGRSDYIFAEESIDICFNKNILYDTEKVKLLENFAEKIAKQASSSIYDKIHNDLENLMFRIYNSKNKNDGEKTLFYNKLFKEFLNNEKLNNKILEININDVRFFQKAFLDKEDKENFINKLLLSNNNKAIGKLINVYFEEKKYNNNTEESNDPIISTINEEKFNILFDHGLSLDSLYINNILLSYLPLISEDKKEILFQNLLSKEDILQNSSDTLEINFFCRQIASIKFQEEKTISDEVVRNIFIKIFSSQYINDEVFNQFINYNKDFFSNDEDMLNQFVLSLIEKGNSKNCFFLLQKFQSEDKPILSEDQVKKLSIKVLQNENITTDIYEMYLDSTKDNLKFYLNQEIFNKNIKKMSKDSNISINLTIGFLVLQKKEKNSSKDGNNYIILDNDQEEVLYRKLFNQEYIDNLSLERLFDLDEHLFDILLNDILNKNELPIRLIPAFILTKGEISNTYSTKIIDYYFANNSNSKYIFDAICDRYSSSSVLLGEIKEKINNLSTIEDRSIYKSKLLQRDLFDKNELKTFYEEIRAEQNVYSQVLLSAEVLGSLVFSDNSEKKENLFKSDNQETQKNINFISSFVKKYSQGSKGRTIAVMLFSREYLPERNMDEVIEKVANTLSKYEKVLDQYKYEGVPDGLGASIGIEYEITGSTAEGYRELKNRELKSDIVRLSQAAHIGNGKDAVHEIATRPTTNPYLLLLEMQLLNDIEYIDFNFDRTKLYQKGARGYHVTIGGENGLYVDANTNFLQNSILAASWGGVHAGETGKRVSGGRGVTLRGRSANNSNNIKVFEKATDSVELRSLSIDKMEQFQRAIITTFNGAIAIQALQRYTNLSSDQIYKFYKNNLTIQSEEEFIKELKNSNLLKEGYSSDEKNMKIIYAWAELTSSIKDAIEYHNNEFLSAETLGYLDENGVWVDTKDFGGNYNYSRFTSVVSSIDPTLSVEEYINSTQIDLNKFFSSFDVGFADSLTKINNLYLKPGNKKILNKDGKKIITGEDQANSISMLEVTKLNNGGLEYRNDDSYLKGTVFNTLGERREGYYCVQGGSKKMITHACQIALLNFNKRMEEIVNK